MNKLNQMLALAGVAAALGLSAGNVAAQGRGGFDPEQMRQRAMDNYKERLEVKSDDEWKIIQDRIEKVTTAQREARLGGGFGGRFGGGRRGGGDAGGGDGAPRRNPFAADNPDADALQKALDAKASPEEVKTKLAKVRESVKDREAKLTKAQDELRKVLSVRQEATAVLMGLLK